MSTTSSKASADQVPAARRAPLAVSPDDFREAGHALVDRIADFLTSLPVRPVSPGEAPDEVRVALGSERGIPEEGAPLSSLVSEATDLLFQHSTFNGHPRFFGYITAAPAPVGMLADLLAAAVNPNVGGWSLSPMATEIEAQAVRWIAELLGYPPECGGLMVSGGNTANFVGFVAARTAAAPELRERGFRDGEGGLGLRAYVSRETHTWIEKAADLYGLGTDAIRWIDTDDRLRMRPDALAEAVAEDRARGERPFLVVGTAGTVSTGALDPLNALADFCESENLWFHVDGAYGGFAAALPDAHPDFLALARADSVAVDPHKWLYAPLEAGCALVRDPERMRAAFSYHPPYYHFGQEAVQYVDYGPQNSRGFRALKVWLALRQVGRRGYQEMIGDDIRLTGILFDAVEAHPELEAATRELSIATFRYLPPDLADRAQDEGEYLDALNEEILDRLERSGRAFVSKAVIGGRFLLRTCIVNFRTERADVEALPEIVAEIGRDAHGELHGG